MVAHTAQAVIIHHAEVCKIVSRTPEIRLTRIGIGRAETAHCRFAVQYRLAKLAKKCVRLADAFVRQVIALHRMPEIAAFRRKLPYCAEQTVFRLEMNDFLGNETFGLKSSKVCRVCRVFCMIMIQKSWVVCQRVPSVCQSVSKSAECPQNHTFANILPSHQSNLVRRFLRL